MDLIIRFFVWVANCFLSGKAEALGFALLGAVVSFVIFKFTPVFFNAAYFLYPNFEQYISEHLMVANLIFFVIYMAPVLIGTYIAFQQLKFIYYKESYRHF